MASCDKEEQIPAYLHIDQIDLQVLPNRSQGSNAHEIVDAWVYVNNKQIGVFELPATIPVLEEGEQEIVVIAGIKKNGQVNNRIAYPFYEPYVLSKELIPGQVDTLNPVVSYKAATQFVWLEDYEDKTISLTKSGSNSTVDSMVIVSDPALVFDYNGNTERYSSAGHLDTGYQILEFSSVQFFDLPRGADDIYLEFNFRSDIEFIAGIYPITGSAVTGVPVVNYFATENWKKAYVSLKEDVNDAQYQGVDFRIFFGAIKNGGDSTANVYLDNIKLIHF